ncbi:MAG: 3-deoxy-8-phosphooctulonate synthase [Betaproteobacteria bacterium]|nr:3-deoxy-8-phosphooctulonate synthase [Betaproteobacteria bacterium]
MNLCGFNVGLDQPFFLIAGPCTAESLELCVDVAGHMKEVCARLGVPYIFKASYDKANRSSGKSARGPGLDDGLHLLAEVRRQVGVPVLTDVHGEADVAAVASVVDVLQTPAFLCRQTDFIHAVASCGKPVNIKKGQFLAPGDMKHVVDKARQGTVSGGQREFVPVLARAAVAVGISGLFMETHPHPEVALSDGPNSWPLARMESLLTTLAALDRAVKAAGLEELK